MNLDLQSRMTLYRLINRRTIGKLGHPIREGKESLVIHALAPDGSELAVKVHTSHVFGNAQKKGYIFGDWRFRHAKRQIVLRTNQIWAEKECRNLARLEKADIMAPHPVAFEDNIVIMSFIGKMGTPAPELYNLQEADFEDLSRQVLHLIRKLVLKAKLIHGDFSAHNILVWQNEAYVIDISQAVLTTHLNAPSLLSRDISNIKDFFLQKNVGVDDEYDFLLQELLPQIEQPKDIPDKYGYRRPRR